MREIAGFTKAVLPWSAMQLVTKMDNHTAVFTNACQRGLVWDNKRKSLLIHSMIISSAIPPFYACHANGKYDFLDGKQRSNAIYEFLHNRFQLVDVPVITFTDGTTEDINGKYYNELPDDIKTQINSCSLSIQYFDEITEDEQEEIFYRLNNGLALSNIEKSRVKCKVLFQIQKLAHHPVFDFLTEKARERYTDEDIIVKCFAMTMMDIPCLDTRAIRPFMETMEITEQEYSDMQDTFTCIKQMHDEMEQEGNTATAKRLYVKTHMISIIPFVKEHDKQTEFFTKFFSGERMTISSKYNDHATAGVGHAPNVRARLDAIEEEWKRFKNH